MALRTTGESSTTSARMDIKLSSSRSHEHHRLFRRPRRGLTRNWPEINRKTCTEDLPEDLPDLHPSDFVAAAVHDARSSAPARSSRSGKPAACAISFLVRKIVSSTCGP